MKRSFIPPSFRPEVRGATLTHSQHHFLEIIRDGRRRRALLVDLVLGHRQLPGIDVETVRHLCTTLFPKLRHLRSCP